MNFSAITGLLTLRWGRIPISLRALSFLLLGGLMVLVYIEFIGHNAAESAKIDQNLRRYLSHIEQSVDLDLSRITPHAKIILRPKVLKFFLDNSALVTLFSLNNSSYEHYFYTNRSQRLYGRKKVSDWNEIPEETRQILIMRPEEFKIFIWKGKIYFGKGRRISMHTSFHFLMNQPLGAFCKEYGIDVSALVLAQEIPGHTTPIFISQSALIMAAQKALKKTALPRYFEDRHEGVTLAGLIFLMIILLAIFSFRKIVSRFRLGVQERLQSEVEFLSENYSDIHQDVQNAQEEIQLLKHNVFLNRVSEEARLKVLEKIFPSYPKIMSNIQMLQAGMITGRLDEKMEDIVLGFKESIEALDTKNREVSVSLMTIIEEMREIFLGEFSKNKIMFEVEGVDGVIGGPVSNVYFIFYFLFKRIALHLPPSGSIHITLHGGDSPPFMMISDNGLTLSPTEKERLTSLMNSPSELVKDPTEEEFQQALDYLGWKRTIARSGDNKTVTIMKFSSSSAKAPSSRNPTNERHQTVHKSEVSNIVCITTKKPL